MSILKFIDKRAVLSFAFILTFFVSGLSGYLIHMNKNLNLSGDEIHFYFLGIHEIFDNADLYADNVILQINDAATQDSSEVIDESAIQNLNTARHYLSIQPDFYSEYQIPKILWGLASRAVGLPTPSAVDSGALPSLIGNSIFYGFLSSGAFYFAIFAVLAAFIPGEWRLAAVIFLILALLRDQIGIPLDSNNFLTQGPLRNFALGLLSDYKDFSILGFSSRSLFLPILAMYCLTRWVARGNRSFDYFILMLPVLSMTHGTHGVIVSGIFLFADVVVHKMRYVRRSELFIYALSIYIGLQGGLGANNSIYVLGLLVFLGVIVIASIAPRIMSFGYFGDASTQASEISRFRGDWVAFGLVLAAVLVVAPLVSAVAPSAAWWASVLQERIGVLMSPIILVSVAFLIAFYSRRFVSASRMETAALALSALVCAALLVFANPFGALNGTKMRVVSHSTTFSEIADGALTFSSNNELHAIWYIVLKSIAEDEPKEVLIDLPRNELETET